MIETNNHYTSPEKEEVICSEGTGEQIDAKEKADREKRQNNIVISGIKEEEGENA